LSDHVQLASQLAQARLQNKKIDAADFDAIATIDEAYQVQSHLGTGYESSMIGYKVGATSEAAQKLFQCDGPFYGPMYERDQLEPGVTVSSGSMIGGEAEFAFQIAKDVASDKDLTTAELANYIGACHVVVEIVNRRTLGEGLPSFNSAIADFGCNGAFILGPAIDNWQSTNLAEVKVVALTNGIETNSGTGAAVLGHPLNSALWLHNALRTRSSGLKKGEWVSTGTCLGVIKPEPGTVEIEFRGCGSISYQVS